MLKKFKTRRTGRKNAVNFNPNRKFIEEAVSEYLNGGGKIEPLEKTENSFENSWTRTDIGSDVDDFLNGN